MTRQQEALTLAGQVMADFELSRNTPVQRLMKTLRMARLLEDSEALKWLGYELNGVPGDDDGRKWMTKTRRWIEKDKDTGYWVPLSTLVATRTSAASTAGDLSGSVSVGGDFASVAMRERSATIAGHHASVAKMDFVISAVEAQLYSYAADVHAKITYSELQAELFASARGSVDAALGGVSGEALQKIDSISERLGGADSEAISQAMSTCRRLIDSVADHVFPPQAEPYRLGDQDLQVKTGQVLNRLNAHLHRSGVTGGRAARLRRTLSDLYERVSSGVHAEVTHHEARFLFLSTYVVLGEVLTVADPRT